MSVRLEGDRLAYDSVRCEGGVSSHVIARLGESLEPPEPGSLEFFLIERYLLYASRGGRLLKGMVHHPPYPLQRVVDFEVRDELVPALGIAARPFEHALFSPGVDVDIFPIRPAL